MNTQDTVLPFLKKTTLLVVGLLIAVGIVGYFFQYSEGSRASADATVNFFFSRGTIETDEGESFALNIQALSVNPVSIATVLISYPRDMVRFDQAKTEESTECQALESLIDLRLVESSSENANTIVLTRGSFKSDELLPKGTFCAGQLYFTGLKESSGTISFAPLDQSIQDISWDVAGPGAILSPALSGNFQQMTVNISSAPNVESTITPTANSTTTSQQNPTPEITTRTVPEAASSNTPVITMKIRLQGVTQKPKSSQTVPVQVSLVQNQTPIDTRTVEFEAQDDGTFIAKIPYENITITEKYSFLLKGPKHLQKRVCETIPQEQVSGTYLCEDSMITIERGENTLDFSKILLLAGDLPLQNGIVDAVDISYIRSNMGSSGTDIAARGDLNYDGIVDSQDYTIIIGALSFKYDE